jgi:Holliday junction resolvase RusA-like endonuclease
MAEIKYTIKLPPVSKKNSQQILMNKKTGRPFIMPSRKFKEYEEQAAWFLKPRPPRPIECALEVKCLFFMPTRRRVDLTNLLEAVDDILVKHEIIADDHSGIVVSHDGSRVLYDKDAPRTEIVITRLDTDQQMSIFNKDVNQR